MKQFETRVQPVQSLNCESVTKPSGQIDEQEKDKPAKI